MVNFHMNVAVTFVTNCRREMCSTHTVINTISCFAVARVSLVVFLLYVCCYFSNDSLVLNCCNANLLWLLILYGKIERQLGSVKQLG